jgi:hypothetical protein
MPASPKALATGKCILLSVTMDTKSILSPNGIFDSAAAVSAKLPYDRLSLSTSAANLRPESANAFLINFNLPGQLIPSGTHHRTTQFMKSTPRSIITAKTKDSFQSESTGSVLLTRRKPHGERPRPKWFVTPMKQSSRSDGRLPFTFPAKKKTTTHQRRLGSLFPATGANKALAIEV